MLEALAAAALAIITTVIAVLPVIGYLNERRGKR